MDPHASFLDFDIGCLFHGASKLLRGHFEHIGAGGRTRLSLISPARPWFALSAPSSNPLSVTPSPCSFLRLVADAAMTSVGAAF